MLLYNLYVFQNFAVGGREIHIDQHISHKSIFNYAFKYFKYTR